MARRRAGVVRAWVYEKAGERLGPIAEPEFFRLITAQQVTADTPVWRQGMDEWIPLKDTELGKMLDESGQPTVEAVEKAQNHKSAQARPLQPPQGKVKPISFRSGALQLALGTYIAFGAVYVMTTIVALLVPAATLAPAQSDQMAPLEAVWGIAALGYLVGFLLSAVAYSFFFHRCMHNIWAVRDPHAEMPAGMVWAWHFVPIAFLFKPYDGAAQIWRGSMGATGRDETIPALFSVWWAGWLIGILGNQIKNMVMFDAYAEAVSLADYREFAVSFALEGVFIAMLLVSAGALFLMTRRLAEAQKEVGIASAASTFS